MEITREKSQEQADIISMIALPIIMLDTEYCTVVAQQFLDQASRQEAMAVLNPRHVLSKNDLLRQQGKALKLLVEYVDALHKVDELKRQVGVEEAQRSVIDTLFL